MIADKGGQILSSYTNNHTKILVECQAGHSFWKRPACINSGGWCAKCAHKCPEQAHETFINNVHANNGIVMGTYVKFKDKVRLQCQEGHVFETSPLHIAGGKWCPKCRNKCPVQAFKRFMAKITKLGGQLMGPYVNTGTKVDLQCLAGHFFAAKPNNVTNDKWCRTCGLCESKGERRLREYFEHHSIPHTQEKVFDWFPRKRYDVYFELRGQHYLVEFDGIQHFEYSTHFYSSPHQFDHRREIDVEKTLRALQAGYHLIRIAHTDIDQIETMLDPILHNDADHPRLLLSDPTLYAWIIDRIPM